MVRMPSQVTMPTEVNLELTLMVLCSVESTVVVAMVHSVVVVMDIVVEEAIATGKMREKPDLK